MSLTGNEIRVFGEEHLHRGFAYGWLAAHRQQGDWRVVDSVEFATAFIAAGATWSDIHKFYEAYAREQEKAEVKGP